MGLQKELQQRARSQGLFKGIAAQVKGWAMANTDDRLQADVWFNYFIKYAPPQFKTWGIARTASVNLGSQVQPCWVTFWGLPDAHDKWIISPWASVDADCGALLDELDGRGGMGALLAA